MHTYEIKKWSRSDVPAVARVFLSAFKESVMHVVGEGKLNEVAIQDIFEFLHDTQKDGCFVAHCDSKVAGYVVAVTDMSKLWKKAILKGYVFKWFARFVRGTYGLTFRSIYVLLCNKLAFASSSLKRSYGHVAQILSIGVLEAHRGKGIGTGLVERALEYLCSSGVRAVKLEVRPDNVPARRIYEKMGFARVGEFNDSQGQWIVMLKTFS
jgi:ribosomal-protein-alanine N-acetyltransferase